MKPLLVILLLIALCAGAASVYGWLFKFPTLNKQVKALEEQVVRLNSEIDRLESQVDRLQGENDRYESLNDRLNGTVYDLEEVQGNLNSTVTELEGVASSLNVTKDQLIVEIDELQDRNNEYASLNEVLTTNVQQLADEVNFFRDALSELSQEHSILKNTTTSLQELATQFANTTIDQNETLQVLKTTLEGFQIENDRLESFNDNLMEGLEYLNQTLLTNGNIMDSTTTTLGEITLVLGRQVKQQQQTTLKQLEISYRQLLAGWDCDYRDVFRLEPFGQDYDSVMMTTTTTTPADSPTTTSLIIPSDVKDYVDERVLSKLCLDSNDFIMYLSEVDNNKDTEGENGVTSNELIRAVVLYTDEAIKYYFPQSSILTVDDDVAAAASASAGEMTMSNWVDAEFRCELLQSPFFWKNEDNNDGSNNEDNNINLRKLLRRRRLI